MSSLDSNKGQIHKAVAYSTNTWVSPVASLRIVSPLQAAGITLIKGNEGDQVNPELVTSADLLLIQRDFSRRVADYEAILKTARRERKPVILDLDDLLLLLPDNHPDRLSGYYDGALMPLARALVEVDAVTTTNPVLRDYLSQFQSTTYLLPNYLDDQLWSFHPPVSPREEITIGYMGGPSHVVDLEMVSPVLERILREYTGRIKLHLLGARPPAQLASLPGIVWENASTYDYPVFARSFPQNSFDIAIAPLLDTFFNQCKSAIKFLEYSVSGFPGVYSRVAPYEEVIQNGVNGFLASDLEEWEQSLRALIESADLRYQIAVAAQATIKSMWLLSDHAGFWQEVYTKSLTGQGQPRESSHFARTILSITADTGKQAQVNKEAAIELQKTRQKLSSVENTLEEIHSSRAWKLVQILWRIRSTLFPRKLASFLPTHPQQTTVSSENGSIQLIYEGMDREDMPVANKVDIILFPIMEWSSRVQRAQQLSRNFARAGHRVFYLHPIFQPDGKIRVKVIQDKIFELYLPAARSPNLYQETLDEGLTDQLLNAFALFQSHFSIGPAFMLVDLPFWTPIVLKLRDVYGWPVVYDCMDFHPGFETNAASMLELEQNLARHSDLVLVTSHILQTHISAFSSRLILLPNGADFQHFCQSPERIPEDIQDISHPIIGYYGAIADWFDTILISILAKARPNWQFVLIGSTLYADLAPLEGLSNVRLLGEKSYADLPGYLHQFDVAIIPFKKTPLTEATNPVKLFEFLSAGVPVVATDLDELGYYRQIIRLALTGEEWLAAIEQALSDRSPENRLDRQEFARQNTWEQRVESIAGEFDQLLVSASHC